MLFEEGFSLWLIRVFKLFNSVLSSFNLVSVDSFCPSIALGMRSFSPRTSSLILRDSSSLRRLANFRSPITLSTSAKALSKRSVRAFSDSLSASVSFASWSRSENAFSKESSIAFLSCSSCGGVGGATIGSTYRFASISLTLDCCAREILPLQQSKARTQHLPSR